MAWFEKDFIAFFKELEVNNTKDWFAENKKRFEKNVKEPFHDFVAEMISRIQKDDPHMSLLPKDAIFRIYRDVRFSKDKTPYKTNVSAVISPGGRKNFATPGIYFEFKSAGVQFYGGAHHVEKEQLAVLRNRIIKENKRFRGLLSEKKFKSAFGELQGENNKRLPKEYQQPAQDEPYLFNKTFYYGTKLGPDVLLSDDLAEQIYSLYQAGKPLNLFLRETMGT